MNEAHPNLNPTSTEIQPGHWCVLRNGWLVGPVMPFENEDERAMGVYVDAPGRWQVFPSKDWLICMDEPRRVCFSGTKAEAVDYIKQCLLADEIIEEILNEECPPLSPTESMTPNWKPVVLSLLQHLETHGLVLHAVDNGGERIDIWNDDPDKRREEIAEEICAVDAARLSCRFHLTDGTELVANLFLVLGNEPEELVTDWECTRGSTSFTHAVNTALDAFEDEWSGVPCPSTQD